MCFIQLLVRVLVLLVAVSEVVKVVVVVFVFAPASSPFWMFCREQGSDAPVIEQ